VTLDQHSASDVRRHLADIRALLDRIERSVAPPSRARGERLHAWTQRWFGARAKVDRDAEHDRGRYEKWIRPRLGTLPVATITSAKVVEWVDWIEERVQAGDLRATTAWRIWTVLSSMMRDTYAAKDRSLRVRTDNPIRDVRGPARGSTRIGPWLYPSEFLRLVSCRRVPLESRRRYALAVYLYPRAGELAALRWADVDLRTGRVHIHQAVKRAGGLGATKTSEDRQFVAEREALRLLRAMRRSAKGEAVCTVPRILARTLRQHLRLAGCTREDLFADDGRRRPLTFHDLRATGITWQAMRGDAPTAISERVGHLHLATTERYMRRGRLMALTRGERVFPRLPESLL
jgi:integrase